MQPDKVKLSFSGRRLLHECARKFQLQGKLRRPWFRPSVELGTAFHRLMELTFSRPLDEVMSRYATWCADQEEYKRQRLSPEEMEKLLNSLDKAKPMWEAYFQMFNGGALLPRTRKVLATEHPFFIELERVRIPGRIDQIVLIDNPWYGKEGKDAVKPDCEAILAVLDYKTTSVEPTLYAQALRRSAQGPLYLHWAQSKGFQEDFPSIFEQYGVPVAVVFDIVETLEIRPYNNKKKVETWEEFLDRYKSTLIAEAARHFHREVFSPSASVIYDTLKGFDSDSRLLAVYQETGYWPKNDKSCLQMGQVCEYGTDCDCVTESFTDQPSEGLVQIEDITDADQDDS
jgi:hypothetical protein